MTSLADVKIQVTVKLQASVAAAIAELVAIKLDADTHPLDLGPALHDAIEAALRSDRSAS
jgi:hypothetical protein